MSNPLLAIISSYNFKTRRIPCSYVHYSDGEIRFHAVPDHEGDVNFDIYLLRGRELIKRKNLHHLDYYQSGEKVIDDNVQSIEIISPEWETS
jgi:hypothetical protein